MMYSWVLSLPKSMFGGRGDFSLGKNLIDMRLWYLFLGFLQAEDASKSLPFTPMLQQQLLKKEERDIKPKESCDTSFSKGEKLHVT